MTAHGLAPYSPAHNSASQKACSHPGQSGEKAMPRFPAFWDPSKPSSCGLPQPFRDPSSFCSTPLLAILELHPIYQPAVLPVSWEACSHPRQPAPSSGPHLYLQLRSILQLSLLFGRPTASQDNQSQRLATPRNYQASQHQRQPDGQRQVQEHNRQKLVQYGAIGTQLSFYSKPRILTHPKSKTVTLNLNL